MQTLRIGRVGMTRVGAGAAALAGVAGGGAAFAAGAMSPEESAAPMALALTVIGAVGAALWLRAVSAADKAAKRVPIRVERRRPPRR